MTIYTLDLLGVAIFGDRCVGYPSLPHRDLVMSPASSRGFGVIPSTTVYRREPRHG